MIRINSVDGFPVEEILMTKADKLVGYSVDGATSRKIDDANDKLID